MTRVVAFDTETRGLDWFDETQRAFLASWADDSGEYVADLSDPAQVSHVLDVLSSADVLVAHNATFDLHQMKATLGWDGLDCALVEDTDLISRVLYPTGQRDNGGRGGHGLKTLAETFLEDTAKDAEDKIADMAKAIGVKLKGKDATIGAYYDVWRAYPEPMEHYARLDARYTYDLYTKFMAEMTEEQERVLDLERAVQPIIYRAEERGVAIDQGPVVELKREYTEILHNTEDYLTQTLGEGSFSGEGSEEALIEALQKQGVPLYRTTDTGKLATNHPALAEFEKDHECIQVLFDWRRASKFLKTYINPMIDRDVVHPNFAQLGAWTSRMSCYRPNMQNIPKRAGKEVREMFVPREGYCFVVSDYEAIESRLLAYYLGDPSYRRLFDEGHDPHAWMAAQIHGGSMADFAKGSAGEADRDDAKNVTYAICYGGGGPRITDMLGLDPGPYYAEDHPLIVEARAKGKDWPRVGPQYKEARALISKVKGSLPGFNRLNNRIKKKIERDGYVSTIIGRRQYVNREKAYVGLNALIQGSAAEIMKQGLVNVDEAVKDLGAIPILVVHDEVVTECPIENADECRVRQEAALVAAFDMSPRLAVETTVVTTNYAAA